MKDQDLADAYWDAHMYKCEVCERGGLSRDEVHRCENGEYVCDRCNKEERDWITPDLKKEV